MSNYDEWLCCLDDEQEEGFRSAIEAKDQALFKKIILKEASHEKEK